MHKKEKLSFHDICCAVLIISSFIGVIHTAHILCNYIPDLVANIIGFVLFLATVNTYESIKSLDEQKNTPIWKEKAEAYDHLNYLLSDGYFIECSSQPIKSVSQLRRSLEQGISFENHSSVSELNHLLSRGYVKNPYTGEPMCCIDDLIPYFERYNQDYHKFQK